MTDNAISSLDVPDKVIEFLDGHDMWQEPYRDLLSLLPGISADDAYQCQFELMDRRAARGDAVIGYKAAGTTRSARELLGGGISPVMGTLTRSLLMDEGATFTVRPGKTFVEAEIAVLLGRDLVGPDVTYLDAITAIDGYLPAMEISPWSPAVIEKKRSQQHLLATQKTGGKIVIGRSVAKPSFDLRYEGAVVEVNGEVVATGAGAEVMGDPVNVVVALANNLARFGRQLRAGMIIMTGSVAEPLPADMSITDARVTFSRLGSLGVRFTTALDEDVR